VKKYSIGDSVAYIGIKVAKVIIGLFPMRLVLWLGSGIGMLMYWFYPKRKEIAYANLKSAFAKEKSPSELKRILKNTYKNYGRTIGEFLRMSSMSRSYIKAHLTMDDLDIVREAKKRGKGAIYLTAHFGNWELSSITTAVYGYPIYVLVRPQKMAKVNTLINSYRKSFGCKVVNKGMASREIIRALKNNEIVGILSDQDAGKRGKFVDFFGRPTSCAIGAFSLAKKTGAAIIPTFTVRKNGPFHAIKSEPIIELSGQKASKEEIIEKLAKFTKIQESYIRKYPDQWFWVHKRWKSTPTRSVLILSDKKQGHINQSKAVLNAFKKARKDTGFNDSDTLVKVVDVEYKSKAKRLLLGLFSRFTSSSCQGCMKCLKSCLTDETYNKLIMNYSDVIISAGSSVAPVNRILSYENNAKSVVIMKPGITGLKKFTLAIIPEHDQPPKKNNVLITKGAPNTIDNEFLTQDTQRLKEHIGLAKPTIIGFLLGGENNEYKISIEFADKLARQLEDLSEKLDAEFLLTTSRRTPKNIEEYLEKRFLKNPRCKLLVIPNKSNLPGALNGILGLSHILIASGDSASMVSEAASSGKHVLTFDLEKKGSKVTKHEKLLENLANSGVIVRSPVERISERALEILEKNLAPKKLDDSEKIYKAVYRII